ncbi:hypothetical protein Rin_00007780, partial [Candidatus Regiella insecticola 5.15]
METFNPSSKQTKTFEEVSQDEWVPEVVNKTAKPAMAWKPLMKDAQKKLDNAELLIKNAHLQSQMSVLPSEVEHILVYHAERMQQRARELGEVAAPDETVPKSARAEKIERNKAKMIAELEDKAREMIAEGRRIRIMMSKQQDPDVNRLNYLLSQGEVSIHKIESRKKLAAEDWMQEYEIRDSKPETVRNQLPWYAHFHYKQEADPFEHFSQAHLKRGSQRRKGAKTQTTQEQQGAQVEPILRNSIPPV